MGMDKVFAERARKEREAALMALYGGVEKSVEYAGGILTGLNFRPDGVGWLLVVKAEFPAGHMVGFVWHDDMASCLIKCSKEAKRDQLRWKDDQWANGRS